MRDELKQYETPQALGDADAQAVADGLGDRSNSDDRWLGGVEETARRLEPVR